jgi:hypothetical protein
MNPDNQYMSHTICEQCYHHQLACFNAVRNGHLECLKEARRIGVPWGVVECSVAASKNNIELLKYMRERGCSWDASTVQSAAACAYECLQYAIENDCPRPHGTVVCDIAAGCNDLVSLKYLHDNGFPWGETTCHTAAGYGHSQCLKYLYDNGCPWTHRTLYYAARSNDLKTMKYLHENGCPWHKEVCEVAAEYGRLECLRYAHENGCPWDENTCKKAEKNIECLLYAYLNGCPWRFVPDQYSDERLIYIWRLKYVWRRLIRNWKHNRFTKRRDAIRKIESAVLHFLYQPGGIGYKRVLYRFSMNALGMT